MGRFRAPGPQLKICITSMKINFKLILLINLNIKRRGKGEKEKW